MASGNARDTLTPPLIERERLDGMRWEWEGSARVYRARPRTTNPEKVCGTDGHDGNRPSAADEHQGQTPDTRRRLASQSSTRGQAARLPAPEQIRAAAQEEHREE